MQADCERARGQEGKEARGEDRETGRRGKREEGETLGGGRKESEVREVWEVEARRSLFSTHWAIGVWVGTTGLSR